MYLEKLKLDGQVAVVTGGGQAIGLACATRSRKRAPRSSSPTTMPDRRGKATTAMKAKGYGVETVAHGRHQVRRGRCRSPPTS